MKRQLLLSLFIFILFVNFTSATSTASQNLPYNVSVSCGGFVCSALNITILYPNSTILVNNQSMSNRISYAFYQVTPKVLGTYTYYLYDGVTFASGTFDTTYRGEVLTTSNAVLYSVLLFILVFIFVITLFGIEKLPNENIRNDEQRIFKLSYLKYLRWSLWLFEWGFLIAIFYMSSNLSYAYFGNQLFADFFLMLFRICLWLTLPLAIVWFLWIFARIVEDRELFNMIERGFYLDGKGL